MPGLPSPVIIAFVAAMSEEKRVFRVLFDFAASERVELTVKKDDIVLTPSTANTADDWLLVEKYSEPSAKGYIPSSTCPEILVHLI